MIFTTCGVNFTHTHTQSEYYNARAHARRALKSETSVYKGRSHFRKH